VPLIQSAPPAFLDRLLSHLPATVLVLQQENASSLAEPETEPDAAASQAAIEALSIEQKRDILERVLRSPQLQQSLASVNVALSEGGLPSVSESLGIKVDNGGFVPGGSVPLGGGKALEAFLQGVKRSVMEDEKKDDDEMETD
jgi:26S proteasome regulatory subunit N13